MTSPPPLERSSDTTADRVVEALVHESLIPTDARTRAVSIVSQALTRPSSTVPPGAGLASAAADDRVTAPGDAFRRVLVEVLAYVGAVLVVTAVMLFMGVRWYVMDFAAQLAVLAVTTGLLAAAGLAAIPRSVRKDGVRQPSHDIRRRLASVLLTGAAVAVALIVALVIDHVQLSTSSGAWALPYLTLALVCVVGYVLSPSLAGQLGVWFGTVFALQLALEWWLPADGAVGYGLTLLGIGVIWAGGVEAGWWREVTVGRLLGCGTAFVGTQTIALSGPSSALGYALCFLLAVAGFGLYLSRQAWAYLALGVAALTVSVTQAAVDWFADSIGAAGMLLVAGATLLGSSLAAMRLWREAPGSRG
ncbi:MAG: hypothetical protein L0H79_02475 [Intrasporangium sp.]|uniref:hypothetical protein n=1 Tax=Intrasporangium sp. TaxID=1925024 RepID=UPI0026488583|nr:hypothetical protein [Intrasporangium sp.]MDN5794601.1 hypothetical protein [Intrasporangium sp.]